MVLKKVNDINSESVQTHIIIMQNIISRMATNSAGCKGLCVALVAAVCAVAAGSDNKILWAGVIPIIIFSALDVCYLALEKGFRTQYEEDVAKLHRGEFNEKDLFNIPDSTSYINIQILFKVFCSWSIWIVYPGLLLILSCLKFAL